MISNVMNVYLTFDIEIWCPNWASLDQDFPQTYARYVYGHSRHGDYGLPKILEILDKYGLHGVFFVEPLFAARFGLKHLATIVELIQHAGQEIQLHLHPEWIYEISPPPLPGIPRKRQHLSYYSLAEQIQAIAYALSLFKEAGVDHVTAFRAGSFGANIDTLTALKRNNIGIDCSFNMAMPISGADLRKEQSFYTPFQMEGVTCYPMSVFTDGIGRLRHAQLGACSFPEMQQALANAHEIGWSDFVILSHNFEMLRVGSSQPDWIVVRRFENLCRFLSNNRGQFNVTGWDPPLALSACPPTAKLPKTSRLPTLLRLGEQAARRII